MSPPTPQQRLDWHDRGYLVLADAVVGPQLAYLQDAFERLATQGKAAWLERVAQGQTAATYYDIEAPLEKDPAFIDLVDHPAWYPLLAEFTDGAPLFLAPQARTVPPWPLSYTGWHPDVPLTNPLHIKVQLYLNDVPLNGGEFAYVPGSHRPGTGPYRRPQFNESMPGHVRLPGRAGTAILFNSYGWHTAMDNTTSTPRRSILLIYEKRTPAKLDPQRYASLAPHCHSPVRRALFGLDS